MLVYAGIDEAGYGPLLGPLCVGCSVLVLADDDPADGPPKLWQRLRAAVCRKAGDKKRRVAIDDSKRLKAPNDGPRHPLRHLERGVMSFVPGAALPGTDDELFDRLATAVPAHDWFTGGTGLPLAATEPELRIARARVHRALAREGIDSAALWCEAVDAAELNRDARDPSGKAAVNFRAAVRLIDRLWQRWPDAHPRVVLDRHGGRVRYGGPLADALPGARVETVAETPGLSRYTLARGDARLTVTFAQGGDGRYLPVALASMTAKLVRELHMLRLNRFFREHLPALAPTAGYRGDAPRYIAEIKPVMRRLRVPAHELVRRS